MTSTELENRWVRFQQAAKEVEGYNKEQALKFLQEAGIAGDDGKLVPELRNE